MPGEEDIINFKLLARRQQIAPSALARTFIENGLHRHDVQLIHMQKTVDSLIELVTADIELSAAAVVTTANNAIFHSKS